MYSTPMRSSPGRSTGFWKGSPKHRHHVAHGNFYEEPLVDGTVSFRDVAFTRTRTSMASSLQRGSTAQYNRYSLWNQSKNTAPHPPRKVCESSLSTQTLSTFRLNIFVSDEQIARRAAARALYATADRKRARITRERANTTDHGAPDETLVQLKPPAQFWNKSSESNDILLDTSKGPSRQEVTKVDERSNSPTQKDTGDIDRPDSVERVMISRPVSAPLSARVRSEEGLQESRKVQSAIMDGFLERHGLKRGTSQNAKEIIIECSSNNIPDLVMGIVDLYDYLNAGNLFPTNQLKQLTKVLTAVFLTKSTKLKTFFLEAVLKLLMTHAPRLHHWLQDCLGGTYANMTMNVEPAIESQLQGIITIARERFPADLHLVSLCSYVYKRPADSRVRLAILSSIRSLIKNQVTPADVHRVSTTSEFRCAMIHMITWADSLSYAASLTVRKATPLDVRKLCRGILFALEELNYDAVTRVLSTMPSNVKEAAFRLMFPRWLDTAPKVTSSVIMPIYFPHEAAALKDEIGSSKAEGTKSLSFNEYIDICKQKIKTPPCSKILSLVDGRIHLNTEYVKTSRRSKKLTSSVHSSQKDTFGPPDDDSDAAMLHWVLNKIRCYFEFTAPDDRTKCIEKIRHLITYGDPNPILIDFRTLFRALMQCLDDESDKVRWQSLMAILDMICHVKFKHCFELVLVRLLAKIRLAILDPSDDVQKAAKAIGHEVILNFSFHATLPVLLAIIDNCAHISGVVYLITFAIKSFTLDSSEGNILHLHFLAIQNVLSEAFDRRDIDTKRESILCLAALYDKFEI